MDTPPLARSGLAQTLAADVAQLAQACRSVVLNRFTLVTSCIETAYLLERTAFHRGLSLRRMVCQATAFSPLMAEAISEGADLASLKGQPGYWAVAIGSCAQSGDFVGRMEAEKNRFVGHVICLADDLLIDPSADQMNRPTKGLHIPGPVLTAAYDGAVIVAETDSGAIVRYVLHPDVAVPRPKSDRMLERMAQRLANSLQAHEASTKKSPAQ